MSWNFTIDDSSPFLTYFPHADGGNATGLAAGWIPWYDQTGYIDFSNPGEGGAGTSFHRTSLAGASVQFQFYGTGVYLYGFANSSYDVAVDGETTKPSATTSDLLFSTTGLKAGSHSVTLTARPTGAQQFAFDRAVVSAPYDNTPAELFYDNTDTSAFKYSGTWSAQNAQGIPNATVSHPWQQTQEKDASVTMDFSDAVGVSIWGMANWGNWVYQVTLDGTATTLNSSTYWKVPDSLLFFQAGLDPDKNHTVTVKSTGGGPGLKMNLNSMRVYRLNADIASGAASSTGTTGTALPTASSSGGSTQKKASINAGAIAGPIVAVALLAVLGYFLWRRRSRGHGAKHDGGADLSEDLEKAPHRPVFPTTSYPSFTVPTSESDLLSPTSGGPMSPTGASGDTYSNGYTSSSVRSPTQSAPSAQTRSDAATGKQAMFSAAQVPAAPPAPANSGFDSSDVDRLVELIAQRIDPRPGRERDDGSAPPEYRGF